MHRSAWFCIWFLVLCFLAQSQTPRPRIGLVLEGGGALGFAHIGVIKFLEENRIPVDLVAGTSMGGLVGALYATGRSPAEIEELTQQINWDAVLGGRTAFQDLSYRRKEDRIAFPNRFEFGLRKGIHLPAGLNSGHQAGLIFDRATLAYSEIKNFDELPIPFRCVATDLTVGQKKVFSSGSLSQALRATMSIPGVFAPTIIDGHVFTDGAAVDNLPVDVAREAGAEIIIAVYLDAGPPNPNQYDSFLTIAARNVSIMVTENELRNMKNADILLNADLRKYTSSDFKLGEEIIPKGREAAEQKQNMLRKLSVSESEWASYISRRASKRRQDIPAPQFVEVEKTQVVDTEVLKEDLQTEVVGKPLNIPRLEKRLTTFTGIGFVNSAGYSLKTEGSRTGLLIRTNEKSYGPPYLNVGINIDGSDTDNVLFGMAGRLVFLNAGAYRAEWRSGAFFGSTYGLTTEYYRPFSARSKWFVAPRAFAVSSPFNIYAGTDRIAQYRVSREGFGIDLGYALNARSELRLGQELLWLKTKKKVTEDVSPDISDRQLVPSITHRYFGVDNVAFPRSGMNVESTIKWYGRRERHDFFQLESRASYFKPITGLTSLFGTVGAGTSIGSSSVADLDLQSFSLGGPLRLGSYGQNELVGTDYFLFQGGYSRQLLTFNPLIGEGLYGLAFMEAGKVFNTPIGNVLPVDGSLALVARTAIGPVFVGVSIGDNSHRKWWFGLGRVF